MVGTRLRAGGFLRRRFIEFLFRLALLQPGHRDRTLSDKLLLCQLDPLQKEVDILAALGY